MFLAGIEAKQRKLEARYSEIRAIISEARLPGAKEYGLSCALKLPRDLHDRLEEVRSRHGLRSLKEAAYKALVLGLATMERLPAASAYQTAPRNQVPPTARVLSEQEISRLKEEGFNCPRVPPPEKHYADEDDEELAAVG